eukprot:TRINITY_DN694_c0_g1_i1.p1 TRINITY_DN694_c0_g1~~TRINITY_DN694_c0_g1_i1.p1  ORF type:complete len:111 (+),score=13.19 TRINITY_DN694_c0_g1_i1:224-556(+)
MTRHLLLTRGDEQEEEEDIEEEEASITVLPRHNGVRRQRSTPAGETPKAVVRKLLSAYEDKGYHLLHYNWYSSVQLFHELKGVGIHCCGAICKNRRGLPNVSAMEAGSVT